MRSNIFYKPETPEGVEFTWEQHTDSEGEDFHDLCMIEEDTPIPTWNLMRFLSRLKIIEFIRGYDGYYYDIILKVKNHNGK